MMSLSGSTVNTEEDAIERSLAQFQESTAKVGTEVILSLDLKSPRFRLNGSVALVVT